MMHGNASRFASKQTTGADQKCSLVRQLYECRPHMLDVYTLEELCRRYPKVDARVVEYELTIARQKRAGEPR